MTTELDHEDERTLAAIAQSPVSLRVPTRGPSYQHLLARELIALGPEERTMVNGQEWVFREHRATQTGHDYLQARGLVWIKNKGLCKRQRPA